MKRRKIDPETKMAAILEGLRGESAIVTTPAQSFGGYAGFLATGPLGEDTRDLLSAGCG